MQLAFGIVRGCLMALIPAVAVAFASVSTAQEAAGPTAGAPRKLAPGVLTVIQPEREEKDTFSGPRPVVEVTEGPFPVWTPEHLPQNAILKEIAKKTTFRRDIWCLEFAFKPVRMIRIELPVDDPPPENKPVRMENKLIWYMVYRVRNLGYHLKPDSADDGFTTIEKVNAPIRFFPAIVLESHGFDKAYLDQLIPVAQAAINRREDPNIRLFNSVEISKLNIEVSDERADRPVWGVSMWEGVDPRTDEFSIYVQGLTNAYRFEDPEGAFTSGDPPGTGRRYYRKTLKLNFWRPGDEIDLKESEIRYGIPGQVDYEWVFR